MKVSTYHHEYILSKIETLKLDDVIIAPTRLSREGNISISQVNELCRSYIDKEVTPILEWDILMTENDFVLRLQDLKEIDLSLFKSIRVSDFGAFRYLLENESGYIELNLETAHHNIDAILGHIEKGQGRISKVILSSELPLNTLALYRSKIPKEIELEVLGLGRILLFYTPRDLVSPLLSNPEAGRTELALSSEESPHRGFPVVRNLHGTFMYNPKDLFLLDQVERLEEAGIENFRVRVDHLDNFKAHIPKILETLSCYSKEKASLLKKEYPVKTIKGFFDLNKSNVLFKKLKNQTVAREDEGFLGEVVDVVKKRLMTLKISSGTALKAGDKIEIRTPDKKIKTVEIRKMFDISMEYIEEFSGNDYLIIPHVSGVSVKSQVYRPL